MSIFINPEEGRIRSGWRLLLQLVVFIALSIVVGLLVRLLPLESLAIGVVAGVIATPLSVWIAALAFDRRPFADFGLWMPAGWHRELMSGVIAGAMAMGGIWALEWAMGYATFDGFGWDRPGGNWLLTIAVYLLMMMAVGFYEELWTRGYQLKVLAEGMNVGRISPKTAISVSILVTSAIFGLLHIANPNASWVAALNITLAGVMLALPYVLTGRLWVSIGIHASWNFFQGAVFGFPVSGNVFRTSLIQTHQQGPDWFTGGSFGPEAGVIGILAMVLLCVWIIKAYMPHDLNTQFRDFVSPPKSDLERMPPQTETQDFVS